MAEKSSLDLRCLSCSFETKVEDDFFTHARIHQFENNFRVRCFYCPNLYQNAKSLQKHLKTCR